MMGYGPDLVMAAFEYLRGVHPDIGLFGSCCANPSLALGGRQFSRRGENLERRFRDAGVRRAIVACPNCAVTLRRIPGVEVLSIWQVLDAHPPESRIRDLGLSPLVLHDPCTTRGEPELHRAARAVLSRLGLSFEEYPANREKTLCCGKKDMLMALEPERAREMLARRVSQSSCRNVLTYCFSCVDSFKSAGCRSFHGLEYVFAPERIDPARRESAAGVWRNRWMTARRISDILRERRSVK